MGLHMACLVSSSAVLEVAADMALSCALIAVQTAVIIIVVPFPPTKTVTFRTTFRTSANTA